MQVVFHFEGDQNTFLIFLFSINLVRTVAVPSQSRVQQIRKRGVGGAEAIYITVGDHFVHSDTRLGYFPQAIILFITLLVNHK